MNHHMDLKDILIKDAAPQIFRRPFLFVEPNSRLLKIATFLAIGPQIYVDGLVVIDKGRGKKEPVGRLRERIKIFWSIIIVIVEIY